MRGVTAADAARALGVQAPRIRQWISRGQVHRYPDGSVDLKCLALRLFRDDPDIPPEAAGNHAEVCHTKRLA